MLSMNIAKAVRMRGAATGIAALGLLAGQASAQTFADGGFTALPSFAWPQPTPDPNRWEGGFARMSTGFQVTSSKRFGSYSGPTVGFEGGKLWRDGNVVYGLVGAFDHMTPLRGSAAPGFAGVTLTRDFAGAAQFKLGTLVADNVLVYGKVGVAAANEIMRFGPTALSPAFSREDIAVRPDARVGVEWAVTDRLTLGLEAGVTGPSLR